MTDPSVLQIVLLVVLGLLAGAVNAIAGGGSLIVFPVLLATGLPPLPANVTNSVAQWPGYAGSTLSARKDLPSQGRRIALAAVPAALGSAVGCGLLLILPQSVFDAVVPVLVLLASLTLGLQPWIKRWTAREGAEHDKPVGLVVVTFVAAVYGGYFGGALGVVLIAVLSLLCADTVKRLNAVKVLLSLVVATVTVILFGFFAPVDWFAVLLLAPSTLVGGYLGMAVAQKMPDNVLRWCVVVLGVAVAIYLFVRG
ncbi:sulfite exporter TauE/SafE family protein [Actinomycetospora termitidis]|uniref:Probable membrane transporter protein n=1 Tax=Actinomycetospora termitidis TaxID=3053470 RepID=A0ABT7M7Y9_9PSEU|nr:sulfite exporter TauE/SafE family protein [Actinomycetospora sp. Odt1-22]MDL5156772.1 sulfite exporter TauE/SafE family protein [Actinomycetospora sp. Odt1-22]